MGLGDSLYCYSDYGPVYSARELGNARFPYAAPALEYPAGLGLILWFASAIGRSAVGFANVSMALSALACLASVWLLWRLSGRRALMFAAAPTIVMYAFLNWDLLALVFALAALAAFANRRDAAAGACLGIGIAIKAFPVLFLLPLALQRLRENDRRAAAQMIFTTALVASVVNAPVAWASFDGWAHFFRFNSDRVVDWGTLWSAGCQTFGSSLCSHVPMVNALSLAAFAAAAVLAWMLVTRAAPGIPRWQLCFPLFVAFFLSNKVYSPQYSLWILPWFALVLPNVRLFLVYQAIDVGIYVTTFGWQQQLAGSGGLPLWPLNLFILLRAALLIVMVVAFTRRARAGGANEPTRSAERIYRP